MRTLKLLFTAVVLLLLFGFQGSAQVFFSEGFESYTANGNALDKNYAIGPNAAANGSGNPWFGPAPPNALVMGSTNGVSPHGGNQMVRGRAPSDMDQNWYNLSYRLNSGNVYSGNISFSFWFYDPLGSGGSGFRDYAAIGYYSTAPANTDYPGVGSLNTGLNTALLQRLSLGASGATGTDTAKYQARVVGATDGYFSGWFNLDAARSVGWHQGNIAVGQPLPDGSASVSFYIDDMVNPVLTHNSVSTWGYNVLELNTAFGANSGYFDDLSFLVVPEPSALALLLTGVLSLCVARRRG